jgi:predicted nucleotidyltransferase
MELDQEIKNITEAISLAVPAERIYLFGSYAYGKPSENSDYDLFVVIPDGSLRPLEAALLARRSLSSLDRKTPVDILADYRSRFDERKQFNTLERKVWREGVVLYERA